MTIGPHKQPTIPIRDESEGLLETKKKRSSLFWRKQSSSEACVVLDRRIPYPLEENLSVPSICCNLSTATHGEKMHKSITPVVNWRFLGANSPKFAPETYDWQLNWFYYIFSCHEFQWTSCNKLYKLTSFLQVTMNGFWIIIFKIHIMDKNTLDQKFG